MSFLSRLFGTEPDPKDALRPLWQRTVEIARESQWYRDCGVPDTVEGRYDMITSVLAVVLIRMEQTPELRTPSVHLTELFVDDMDGQLREQGIGDPALGKYMGRMMSAMGGRLGAFRDSLMSDRSGLEAAVKRNLGLAEGAEPAALAKQLEALHDQLASVPPAAILDGEISR
ncbi:ubiquinol-cytochrome C chaperone family protein [Allopontixanthobacter sp.]|uniref:ubiquinol-cytochrome C chaperone family protein n=1 Tax=Allopontixanthobacter sp. TaxID=2906452 RepID=UPI002AC92C06|nr:ubiquinol-cytochrome C chaperone family protein [Allopontixanthobacter sp.]